MIKRLQPTRLTNHHERNVKPILDLSSGDFPMIDAFIAYFAGLFLSPFSPIIRYECVLHHSHVKLGVGHSGIDDLIPSLAV